MGILGILGFGLAWGGLGGFVFVFLGFAFGFVGLLFWDSLLFWVGLDVYVSVGFFLLRWLDCCYGFLFWLLLEFGRVIFGLRFVLCARVWDW